MQLQMTKTGEILVRCLVLAVLLWVTGVQSNSGASTHKVILTSVCEVLAKPSAFNGRMIRVRGRVGSGFESFTLEDDSCNGSIWLTSPDEPESRDPSRPKVQLQRDGKFQQFQYYVSMESSDPLAARCGGNPHCPRYEVTATLVGRLDYKRLRPPRDRKGREVTFRGGFGHLGQWSSRLVIESVSEVAARDLEASGERK